MIKLGTVNSSDLSGFTIISLSEGSCPRILLEYAVHGNMRDFLRQNRPSDSVSVDDVELPSINSSLDLMSTPDLVKLNPQALLRFGCHVADALTYLESLKLVHRDIAARNVLVTEGYVAKLCDFGLSCPLVDGCYVDEFRERLPFRWMAPESLHDNRFSLKSDVWSFGIYLWELFSLGYTPYPGLSCADIDPWLAAGYRNAQPSMASAEVYRIMLDCWHTEPSLRPSAKSLLDDLKLLVSSTLRSSSRDSGLTSGYRSRQTSGTNPSTSSSVPRPRPVPPVRTVSLPGYTNLPESRYALLPFVCEHVPGPGNQGASAAQAARHLVDLALNKGAVLKHENRHVPQPTHLSHKVSVRGSGRNVITPVVRRAAFDTKVG
ncbi:protein tyrosine kinase, partial [Opisthorchis viverrini]